MQRALQERPKPQPLDQQIREQLDRHRLEIKAWKDGFFEGALAGFMLAFLIVFLVGPVAGFLLAFLLVFLAALWVKFCSRVRLTSPKNDGKPRGIPGINTGPRSGRNLNRSSSSSMDSQGSSRASVVRGLQQFGKRPQLRPDRCALQWSAAEPDLVSVGIAVRDLAYAVRIGFPLRGLKSPIGDLRDERIEVIDEERVPGVAGVFWLLHNVHVPMRSQLPHGLCVVWKEGRRLTQ